MKTCLLIISVVILQFGYAQQDQELCKRLNSIPLNEASAHYRLASSSMAATASSSNIDVKFYRCVWNVDPAVRYISGSVTVYFTVITPLNSIYLDLMDELGVDSVFYHHGPVTSSHANNILQVSLPAGLAQGNLDSVTIFYQGVPPNTGFGAFVQSSHAGIPVIWTLSEPYGSRDWWPCKNGLDDKADSIDVTVIHPSIYKAASNGLLQNETISGSNTVTHWKHRYPIATYLICFAVTNYSEFTDHIQLGSTLLPMQTFCYPESLPSFTANTPLVLNTIRFYNDLFGEYPFIKEKYGHVQFGWGGGQEHQTSTFIVAPDESLMAHELAHQWFGDKITCASWQDIWLNEGFATHLAAMYMEKKNPSNSLAVRKEEIDYITSLPGGSVWVDDTTNVFRIFDGRLSYYKGSHLLYMLRWKLGDSVFIKGIRNYLIDPAVRYGFANTGDLKRNLELASGMNLDEFFKDWYYGQGYPTYHVKWSQLGDSYVRITVGQETSHPSVNFFDIPIALQFKNGTRQKTVVIDPKINGQTFFQNIGFVADSVIIDPEYWIISRNNTSEKTTDNANGANVVQVFPNPVSTRFYIYMRNFSVNTAAITLHNELGQMVFKKNIIFFNGTDFEEIPSEQLQKGVYFLKLWSGGILQYTKKMLKQ